MTNEKEWFKLGELVRATVEHRHLIPLFLSHVHAGFPSPADNYIEKVLSLDDLCIVHPEATYFYRVAGDCMIDERICEGDILLVDCAIDNSPSYLHGKVVVAWIDGEYVVRRFVHKEALVVLMPANANYLPIYVQPDERASIIGEVIRVFFKPSRNTAL